MVYAIWLKFFACGSVVPVYKIWCRIVSFMTQSAHSLETIEDQVHNTFTASL